ncbi:hypothetical protein HDZ31DRAFT_77595 [Schizophyllum fasciatum]
MHFPTIAKTTALLALLGKGVHARELNVNDVNLPRLADCAYHCGIQVCAPGTPYGDPSCPCLFGPTYVNPYIASCMAQQCPRDQMEVAFGTLYTYCSRPSPEQK